MITTLFYGFKIGVFLFLISRIIWGLSYATLRVNSLAYASEAVKNKNIMFGLVQSIKTTSDWDTQEVNCFSREKKSTKNKKKAGLGILLIAVIFDQNFLN